MALSRYPSSIRRGGWPSAYGDWGDLIQGMMSPPYIQRALSTGTVAPVDVYERENEFVINMACAGCRPEDIDVTDEDDVMRIRGRFTDHGIAAGPMAEGQARSMEGQTRQGTGQMAQGQATLAQGQSQMPPAAGQMPQGQVHPHEQCLIRELPTGRFERDITLPMGVNAQEAQASFENGLLTLILPKMRAPQGHHIPISRGRRAETGKGSASH